MAKKERKPRKLTMLHAGGCDYRRRIPSVTLAGLRLKEYPCYNDRSTVDTVLILFSFETKNNGQNCDNNGIKRAKH